MGQNRKILSQGALRRKLTDYRRSGKKIAFTNGCFDILHYGHVSYLQKAKKKDRILVVGLNSDASVKRIKGPKRPLNQEMNRAGVLAALECVDHVVIFEEETPAKLIARLQPDVLVKGADWKGKEIAGSDTVLASGGKIELINVVPGLSTTALVQEIQRRKE